MGELKGYVSRSTGGRAVGLGGMARSLADSEQHESFFATKADGTPVASFPTAARAQRGLEASIGGQRLKWTRIEDGTGREVYEGRETQLFPGDLESLIADGGGWWRTDRGVRQRATGPAPAPRVIPRWSSPTRFNGVAVSASNAVPAQQPEYADPGSVGGRVAARFSLATPQALITNLTTAIPSPFAIFAFGRYANAGRKQTMVKQGAPFELGVSAAAAWEVITPAGTITGPSAAATPVAVLSAIADDTNVTAFLNGTAFGSNATAVPPGDWQISDSVDGWHEDLFEVLIIPQEITTTLHQQIVDYFARYYRREF